MRILVRGGKPPHVAVSPEASLARWAWGIFGANVGNTLFLESVYKTVATTSAEIEVDSLYVELTKSPEEIAAEINEKFDVYVVPLANAFRDSFEGSLRRLTSVISKLTIPVIVPGVGGQSGLGSAMGGLDEATTLFIRAVLEKSESVGVRGERTASYLRSLGFPDDVVDVIGCPSMFDTSGMPAVTKRVGHLTPESPIALSVSPSAHARAFADWHADRYPNAVYVPQEHAELAALLWGESYPAPPASLPIHRGDRLYEEDRVRFFLDPTSWRGFMRERTFAIGMRIHGTIAALSAGTPAVLIAHDSRTLELAEYHRIPHMSLENGIVDAAAAYDQADFAELNGFRSESKSRYVDFFRRNGVPTVHDPGNSNPEYAELLERTRFPDPVDVIEARMSMVEREILRKLNWLRQGATTDSARWVGGYMPSWKPKSR